MRILLVEPNDLAARATTMALEAERHNIDRADTGEEALAYLLAGEYDAIVAEMDIPDMAGDVLIGEIRKKVATPILCLTGLFGIDDKVLAFKAGADDFMSKPYNRMELAARIAVLARRASGHPGKVVQVGNLSLDLLSRVVRVAGRPLYLTGTEYAFLEAMALRVGRVMTRDALLTLVYQERDEPRIKIIDVYVCKLRKKLAAAGCDVIPTTVWGRGFMIDRPVAEVA